MYICLCRGITEAQFQDMVARQAGSCEGVKREMGLDETCCGCGDAQVEELIGQLAVRT
jgi:bacterioferritin-associated ferredoxin